MYECTVPLDAAVNVSGHGLADPVADVLPDHRGPTVDRGEGPIERPRRVRLLLLPRGRLRLTDDPHAVSLLDELADVASGAAERGDARGHEHPVPVATDPQHLGRHFRVRTKEPEPVAALHEEQ